MPKRTRMPPYKKRLNDAALPEWQQAALAASRGACARLCGETSVRNPYLDSDSLPAATGQNPSTWFRNCDSWWKGWDGEDARCRESAELVPNRGAGSRSADIRDGAGATPWIRSSADRWPRQPGTPRENGT